VIGFGVLYLHFQRRQFDIPLFITFTRAIHFALASVARISVHLRTELGNTIQIAKKEIETWPTLSEPPEEKTVEIIAE